MGSGVQVATVRLVSEGGLKNGRYEAGVDLTMLPGSHTYWKIPGEAGVPPVFVFNGSENVDTAEVSFPVPKRLTEDTLDTYGYTGRVVFPVTVKPNDRSKPSRLHLVVDYAVCNKICIPEHSEADLELKPHGKGQSPELVVQALAQVPKPATSSERDNIKIAADKGSDKPQWTLTWSGTAPLDDIFAVAPEGFYFSTKKKGPRTWTLTAAQSVSTQEHTTVQVSLVLARKNDSLTVPETLDVGAPGQ